MKDCCSLEIAKNLKEAGWKQDSSTEFYWAWWKKKGEPKLYEWGSIKKPLTAAAPTIGELLEALPNYKFEAYEVGKNHDGKYYATAYIPLDEVDIKDQSPRTYSDSPADALALLWIALKDKGLI